MKYIFMMLCLFFGFVGSGFAQSEPSQSVLIFTVANFESNNGKAVINLFREQDKIPKKPFKIVTAKIINKAAVLQVNDLPFGDYAAILYHDKNGNDKLDHRFFFPAEPLTFTNDWHLSLLSGMPNFEKLRFSFSATSDTVKLRFGE